MRGLFLMAVVVSLSITACVKDETSTFIKEIEAPTSTKKPKKFRPFKGKLVSFPVPSVELDCDCGDIPPMYLSGTGNVTHMGKIHTDGVSCSIPQPFGFSVNGCVSLVAANGDEVFSDIDPYDLIVDPSCFCKATGYTSGQIIGGTGRFDGATGYVDIAVELDLETFEFVVNLDGEIDY